jgi:cyclophilin family peptidyl-prolyl cis-trans isomerase
MQRWLSVAALAAMIVVLAGCGEDETPIDGGDGAENTSVASTATGIGSSGGGETQVPMQWTTEPAMQLEEGKDYGAVLHTSKGDIVIDLFETEAPRTVNNFVFLANQGYFANVPFHRVIKGFMVQTGDPTGTGRGGPGYRFSDEPVTREYVRGTVAMANAGANTNGSQFFIVHADYPLPKNYTIFGIVVDGWDALDAIANVPVGPSSSGENSRPAEPVSVESVEITSS